MHLQFYTVLTILLLVLLCCLLLLPHKSNGLIHLFRTEVVPHSFKVTFYRIKPFILCFGLFQTLFQIPDRILFTAPNNENPNLFSIGEGFGFFVFFGKQNEGSIQLSYDRTY